MTKKHFIDLAERLKALKSEASYQNTIDFDIVYTMIEDFCIAQNPKFHEGVFFQAVYGVNTAESKAVEKRLKSINENLAKLPIKEKACCEARKSVA